MLCHKCPHSAEIERLRETCLACLRRAEEAQRNGHGRNRGIDNLSNKGRRVESIDAYPDRDMPLERRIRPVAPSGGERLTSLPLEVETRLREKLAAFMRLSFLNQMLLIWILRGGTLSEFARMGWIPKKGIRRQSVAQRVEVLKRNSPEMADMIQAMIALNAPSGSRKNARRSKRPQGK